MKKVIVALLALILALPIGAQTRQRNKQTTNRTTTTQTNNRGKRSGKATTTTKTQKANYTTNEIKGLQSQRQQIEQDIRNQQNKLKANKEDVEQKLNNLLVINGEIESTQKDIEGFESDIQKLDGKSCFVVVLEYHVRGNIRIRYFRLLRRLISFFV